MYTTFAAVYDDFMIDTPYDTWEQFLYAVFKKANHTPRRMIDLGCGTGNMSKRLSENYHVIGVDNALDMLMEARKKDPKTFFIQQDMRHLKIDKPVDTIISLCDSFNYLLTEADFLATLQAAYNALENKGLLVFDMKTIHAFKKYGENVFTDELPHATYIWENFFDDTTYINEYCLTLFIKDISTHQYHKSTEIHQERAYDIPHIEQMLAESGFTCLGIYDEASFLPTHPKTMRMHVICQKII